MSNLRGNISIDSSLSEAINGIFGESFVEQRTDDILIDFATNEINERFDFVPYAVTGDGTVTAADSLLTVESLSIGTAEIETIKSALYVPAHTGYSFFTASFDGSGKGGVGLHDLDDDEGIFIEVNNGVLTFGYERNGVKHGSEGALGFDTVDLTGLGINLTKLNIYFITYGYLGVANPTLWIKKDRWYAVHTVLTEGRLDGTHVSTPVFPMSAYAEDGMTVKCGSWCAGSLGKKTDVNNRGFGFPNLTVTGVAPNFQGEVPVAANTTEVLAMFRAKSLFRGKKNHKKVSLTSYHFTVDIPSGVSTGTAIFQIIAVQGTTGTPSWSDISTDESVMEYEYNDALFTGSNLLPVVSIPIPILEYIEYSGSNKGGNTGTVAVNAEALGAYAYHDQVFAVLVKNVGGANITARARLSWKEE